MLYCLLGNCNVHTRVLAFPSLQGRRCEQKGILQPNRSNIGLREFIEQVPLDPSVAWRMRALVNLTSFCRLDKLNWKIGYRRFCSGQCLHRLVRHVWSKGWDSRESRPQRRFPAPRHRSLPHFLPLAITPPGEGRPCQPHDCPYPPDFTRLLLFGAPWSYPGHGLLGGNHSVVIGLGYASGHRSNEGRRCTSLVTRLRPSRSLIAVCSFHVMCSREH